MDSNKIINADINDLYLELWFRNREKNNIIWKCKDGTEIPINKMTNDHLLNAIKYFEKKDNFDFSNIEF